MVERDNLHYNFRNINGYNKAINIAMSCRELGKTAQAWLDLVYFPWKKTKKPWIYLVRQSVEVTPALLDSILDNSINKFTDDNVQFQYSVSALQDGIVDIKINGELFFRVVSLSIKLRRIKLAVLRNIGGVLMDEYIIDPRSNESYLANEGFKIKEAYTTWARESEGVLKMYILGNPYSLFNPLFITLGVDVSKLRRGEFYVGDTYVIHWATMNPLLKQKLLEKNPFYQFDEEYTNYALEGVSINDKNIRVEKKPNNFYLRFVMKIDNKYLGIFQSALYDENTKYFVQFIDSVSARRVIYCFDFNELVEHAVVLSMEERNKLQHFKNAFRQRLVAFEDINCYYYIEEIYKNI